MKKFIAVLTLFVGLSANAGLISIELSEPSVAVGETVSINLVATGFGEFDTFDLDFDFDTSVFNYDPTSLASDLDLGILFEVNQVGEGMALSFYDFSPVNGDFLLASFDLVAVGEGQSTFAFSDVLFTDTLFDTDLIVDTSDIQTGEVVTAVSAPATLGLFTISLLGLVGVRRKA
ncbi:hypothetical protein [uncultured Paraglaciecola sp.]|uniref:hypothetical protein n=1 Tax=uncultured Paraglaciecola sp. TaxID=1765024 RepID=UPI00261DD932|nr:hypothetical protein [uncultured Paraglaciecola sp.]